MFDEKKAGSIFGKVIAVSLCKKHTFSKENQEFIKLVRD